MRHGGSSSRRLSCHDEWHFLLNRWELDPRDESKADVDARIAEWPAHLRERTTWSWELALDLSGRPRRFFVQGVTEAPHLDEVVDAVLIE